jgi:hypothetical protein
MKDEIINSDVVPSDVLEQVGVVKELTKEVHNTQLVEHLTLEDLGHAITTIGKAILAIFKG